MTFQTFYSTPAFAQISCRRQHLSQYGFVRAVQTSRRDTPGGGRNRCLPPVESASECHFHALRVLDSFHQPLSGFTRRMQCVSVTIAGFPNTSPIMRLALFLPTPGSFNRALKSSGTCPPYSSRSIFIQALMSRALLCNPRPHGFTIASMSSTGASRQCRHIWIFLKQSLDYHIDTRIGTLRRRTDTDQQLHADCSPAYSPHPDILFFRRSITSNASSSFVMFLSLLSALSFTFQFTVCLCNS